MAAAVVLIVALLVAVAVERNQALMSRRTDSELDHRPTPLQWMCGAAAAASLVYLLVAFGIAAHGALPPRKRHKR